jgi:hypothetical protein
METTPQGKKPASLPSFIGTAVAVIVAFLLGIFVGLHPSWIPLHTSGPVEPDLPSMTSTPSADTGTDNRDRGQPTTEPATAPAAAG